MFVTSIDCLADSVAPLANALHLMLGNLNGLLKRETVLQEMEWHCGPFGQHIRSPADWPTSQLVNLLTSAFFSLSVVIWETVWCFSKHAWSAVSTSFSLFLPVSCCLVLLAFCLPVCFFVAFKGFCLLKHSTFVKCFQVAALAWSVVICRLTLNPNAAVTANITLATTFWQSIGFVLYARIGL